jgi:hypothetical protein
MISNYNLDYIDICASISGYVRRHEAFHLQEAPELAKTKRRVTFWLGMSPSHVITRGYHRQDLFDD